MTSRLCATAVAGCCCVSVVFTGHHQCAVVRSLPACTGLGRSSGSRCAQEQGRSSNGCSGRRPQHAPAGAVWQQHGCVRLLALCFCSCPDISCSQVGASFFPSAHTHTHTVRSSQTLQPASCTHTEETPSHCLSTNTSTLACLLPPRAFSPPLPGTQAPVRSLQAQSPARLRQQGSRCASPTWIPACVQPRGLVVLMCCQRRARW